MPYLGDYLGQLLSEISMARMQADLETVRLAELYAMHPLLRTMPVPHVRLPEVEMEIPVLIKASEEPRVGESTRGGAAPGDMKRKFDEVLTAQLSKAGVLLSEADRKKLSVAISERFSLHGLPPETSVDVYRVADDLVSTALRFVEKMKPGTLKLAATQRLSVELKDAARVAFLNLRIPPPRLIALVTTAEVREAGTTENITRLRLKVSEENMEWSTIESEGLRHDRLIPE